MICIKNYFPEQQTLDTPVHEARFDQQTFVSILLKQQSVYSFSFEGLWFFSGGLLYDLRDLRGRLLVNSESSKFYSALMLSYDFSTR